MEYKLNVLFVGLGSIGKRHIKNLKIICDEKGIELSCDALRSSNSPLNSEIKPLIHHEYYSVEELPYYDIIFITNPSNLHYEMILKLNSKADSFFIEKPLDVKPLTEEQLKVLDKNKVYYIACPLRHTGVYKGLLDIIKDKKIFCARAICTSYLPEWRKGIDYRNVYSAKKESGGVKIDLIHEFDYLFSLFGFPEKFSMYERKISDLEIESPDYVSFIGDYGNMFTELHLDYFGRIPTRNVELYSDDDVIVCDFNNSKIRINNEIKDYAEDVNKRYLNEIEYFLSLIKCKKNNLNDIINANKVLQFITQGES